MTDGSSNIILIGERATRTMGQANPNDTNPRFKNYGAAWSGMITAKNPGRNSNNIHTVLGLVASNNSPNWGVNGWRVTEGLLSSYHPGGASAGFGDGSTHYIDENISQSAYRYLAAMSDGNVVPSF
jgi:hypothetical protein